jgi:TRAP transporter TAXI family solute receptor
MMKKAKKLLIVLLTLSVLIFIQNVANAENLIFTAGAVGGGWYTEAAGMSEIVHQNYPDINIKVIPGTGIVNPGLVGQKQADFGWTVTPMHLQAYQGVGMFKEGYPNLRIIGGSFTTTSLHIVANADFAADSWEDIVKKKMPIKIGTNVPGATDEFTLHELFKFYGLTVEDFKKWGGKIFFGGYAEAGNMFKDRHVDIIIGDLSAPAAVVEEVSLLRKVKLLSLSKEVTDALEKKGYTPAKQTAIPAGTYKGIDKLTWTSGGSQIIVTHKDVPVDAVYKFTKVMSENTNRLKEIHSSLAKFDPKKAPGQTFSMELHPGCIKYYKEVGWMD